jgi:putative addiction module component (TIGR02574 family)
MCLAALSKRLTVATQSDLRYSRSMSTLDIARLTVSERLDLIGELWDSLAAKEVSLSPAQEAELVRRVATFDFAHDDLSWAKPYVDEAIAEFERGEVVTLDELKAHLNDRFGPISE